MRNLEILLGILALLGVFVSAFLWIEGRYAKTNHVKQVERRLDLKIFDDQLQNVRERIWGYEELLNIKPKDNTARDLLRTLRKKERDLEK